MISREEAMEQARQAIQASNLVVNAALEVLEEVTLKGDDRLGKSCEEQVATLAKFVMAVGSPEDAVVVAAVAIMRLAGRDTAVGAA